MSVGGADHRIPQCNHLTLFGSAVSVVEFPGTASSFVGWFRSFPSGEVVSQFVDSVSVPRIASFESTAKRPLSLRPCHAPFFGEENVAVTLSAWRKVL